MKKRNLIAVAIGAFLLAACIPSVYPFYTDKDVIDDPHLVGEWQDNDNTNNPEIWVIEQSTNKSFDLTVTEEGKTGKFTAYLFQLKQERFLDIFPAECKFASNQADLVAFSMFAGHLLFRVAQTDPQLKLATCDYDWLEKYLEKNPSALAHHNESGGVVLMADTRDLQKFVLKHLGTNELFKEYGTMARKPKP